VAILFEGLTEKMKLEDVTGKRLLAIEVFGLSIQALTSHMQNLPRIQPYTCRFLFIY
jgi:hypothetical protein